MERTKQTARTSSDGNPPRKQLETKATSTLSIKIMQAINLANLDNKCGWKTFCTVKFLNQIRKTNFNEYISDLVFNEVLQFDIDNLTTGKILPFPKNIIVIKLFSSTYEDEISFIASVNLNFNKIANEESGIRKIDILNGGSIWVGYEVKYAQENLIYPEVQAQTTSRETQTLSPINKNDTVDPKWNKAAQFQNFGKYGPSPLSFQKYESIKGIPQPPINSYGTSFPASCQIRKACITEKAYGYSQHYTDPFKVKKNENYKKNMEKKMQALPYFPTQEMPGKNIYGKLHLVENIIRHY